MLFGPIPTAVARSRSPARRGVVLAATLALVMGGCNDIGNREQPGASDSSTTMPPSLAESSQRNRDLVGGGVSGPWTLVKAAGATLVVQVEEGGCLRFDRLAVNETAQDVAVASVLKDVSSPGQPCTAEIRFSPRRVRLESPLGDRPLLHAHVDPDWGKAGRR